MLRRHVFPLLGAALVFAACTHDFDAFEPGAAEAEGGADGGPGPVDASGDRNAADATGGPDAAKDSGSDAAGVCVQSTLDTCTAAQTSCITTCDQQFNACDAKCGPPGCHQKCKNDQTTCHNTCDATCASCAGPACKCPLK